jgi:hypothetical protein
MDNDGEPVRVGPGQSRQPIPLRHRLQCISVTEGAVSFDEVEQYVVVPRCGLVNSPRRAAGVKPCDSGLLREGVGVGMETWDGMMMMRSGT